MATSTESIKKPTDAICRYSLGNLQSRKSTGGITFDSGFISFLKTESFISKDDILNTAYIEQLADMETSHESIYALDCHLKRMFESPNRKVEDASIESSVSANSNQHEIVANKAESNGCTCSVKENCDPIKTVINDKASGIGKDPCNTLHLKAGVSAVTQYLEKCHVSSATPSISRLPLLPSLYNIPEGSSHQQRENTCVNKEEKSVTSEAKCVSTITHKASTSTRDNAKEQKALQETRSGKRQRVPYFPPILSSDKPSRFSTSASRLSNIQSKASKQINSEKNYNSAPPVSRSRNSISLGKKLSAVAPEKKICSVVNKTNSCMSKAENQKNIQKTVNQCNFPKLPPAKSVPQKKLMPDIPPEARAAGAKTVSHNLNRLSSKINSKPKIPTIVKKTSSERTPSLPSSKKATPKQNVLTGMCDRQNFAVVRRVTATTTVSSKFSPKMSLRAKSMKSAQKMSSENSSATNRKQQPENKKPFTASKVVNEPFVRKVNGSFSKFPRKPDLRSEKPLCISTQKTLLSVPSKKTVKKKVANMPEKAIGTSRRNMDSDSAGCLQSTESCHLIATDGAPIHSQVEADICLNLPQTTTSVNKKLTDSMTVENVNTIFMKEPKFMTSHVLNKSFGKSRISVQNLEMIPHVLENKLKHLHPFLETGSYDSSVIDCSFDDYQKIVKQNRVTFCPQLSTIIEIDSPFPSSCEDLLYDFENSMSTDAEECKTPVHLWSKHINMGDDTLLHMQRDHSKRKSFLAKLKDTSSSNKISKDSLAFQSLEKIAPSANDKNIFKIPSIPEALVTDVPSVKSLGENMFDITRNSKVHHNFSAVKLYGDISQGILEEPDLTLVGSELTISTMKHEEYCGPLNGKETVPPVQLVERDVSAAVHPLSDSLLSFLQHEISCMNSPDSVVSLIHQAT